MIEIAKNEILEEVWQTRDEISAECGHDLTKLAAMLRREETKCGSRLARLPIRRHPKASRAKTPVRKSAAAHRP